MRASYPIKRWAYEGGGLDDYGSEIERWSETAENLLIFGANKAEVEEDAESPAFLVITRRLLIPAKQNWNPRDRVELPDEPGFLYEVEGVQMDSARNPFGWNPGGTLLIRRTDG